MSTEGGDNITFEEMAAPGRDMAAPGGEKTAADLEAVFHRLLEAGGHDRPSGRNNGLDWFATNLEFLDEIAWALGCRTVTGEALEAD